MSIGISLGWNTYSTEYAVKKGLRTTKLNGYNTCVFDLMVSNYPGIIQCFEDDFKYFVDLNYIQIKNFGENYIYNTKYNFWFNHESPGHANLYIRENWKNGINHFTMNNYEKFIERYNRRIHNFRTYLHSGNHINFILNRHNTTNIEDIHLLNNTIIKKYPLLKFNFTFISQNNVECIYNHLKLMNFNDTDDEIKRLNNK